jgi:uncharacterized Ntn-hydrolase superfamily protein
MPAIVGYNSANGDLGVAIAYKVVAIGAHSSWAKAGVGAVATVGRLVNTGWGPRALQLLASGKAPDEVIRTLIQEDDRPEQRQIAIVDARGRSATYTGADVATSRDGWAGGFQRRNLAVVGSRHRDDTTLVAMADRFERTSGQLWDRLMAALDAGVKVGLDIRTRKQYSAALLVVRKGGGRSGFSDRMVDLRVDDNPRPVDELERLLAIHRSLYTPSEDGRLVTMTPDLVRRVQARLALTNVYQGSVTGIYDAATREAVARFSARENLEEQTRSDEQIDPRVLQALEIRVPEKRASG